MAIIGEATITVRPDLTALEVAGGLRAFLRFAADGDYQAAEGEERLSEIHERAAALLAAFGDD